LEKKNRKLIVQVGHYPPPIGGVSNYIRRIKEHLDFNCIKNQVWDISRIHKNEKNILNMPLRFISVPFYVLFYKEVKIIHFNIRGNLIKIYIGFFNKLFLKNRKKIITIHGNAKNIFKNDNKLIKFVLNSFDTIICVKKNDKALLRKKNIITNIEEIPSFIPPIYSKNDSIKIPPRILKFIDNANPVLYANASEISVIKGVDLYGIDLCIELCDSLRREFPQIGLIFFISSVKNKKYFNELKNRVLKKNLEKNFLFVTENFQIYPLINKTDLFLRPSNSDGDAISIREALYYKVPTIASNIIQRPKGTVTFKNRNLHDLKLKTIDLLKNYNIYKNKVENISVKNNFYAISQIYENYLKPQNF
jgi:glycosyltransferase involved in cell wall biosynthesis